MKFLLSLSLIIFIPAALFGQSVAVKGGFGTMGIGAEGSVQLNQSFSVRAGGNMFNYTYSYTTSDDEDFDIDADLSLSNLTAIIDWHPFQNGARVSGGIVYNQNTVNSVLIPKQSHTVGGDVYSPEDLGNVHADFRFPDFAPYLALGYGNPFSGRRFGFNVDLGIVFQGEPNVDMNADGLLAPSASQAAIIEDNVGWASLYPAITVGMYYRLN